MTPAVHLLRILGGWLEVGGPWDVVDDGLSVVVVDGLSVVVDGILLEAPSGITVVDKV